MLPRFKPFYHITDFFKLFTFFKNDVEVIEKKFSEKIGVKNVLYLPYGRAAIYLLLKAFNIENKEIIIPAYTCQVVLGPVVATNNIPVFVDNYKDSFEMNYDDIIKKINKNTKSIIIPAMYGIPVNLDFFKKNKKKLKNIFKIGDYALGYYTFQKQKEIIKLFDIIFFSFGISKEVNFLGGGFLITDDDNLFHILKRARDKIFHKPHFKSYIKSLSVLFGSSLFFNKYFYNIICFLSNRTSILNHLKQVEIGVSLALPADFYIMPNKIIITIGINHLNFVDKIIVNKSSIVNKYFSMLKNNSKIVIPPRLDTLSHFPILISDRNNFIKYFFNHNIHLTNFIVKPLNELPLIEKYNFKQSMINSKEVTRRCVLLPLFYGLSFKDQQRVIKLLKLWLDRQ